MENLFSLVAALVVFAAIDGSAPGRVLIVGIKDKTFRQNHLAVKVAALVTNTVWDVTRKQSPFVATAMIFDHIQEQHLFRLCPIARPLLLRFGSHRNRYEVIC